MCTPPLSHPPSGARAHSVSLLALTVVLALNCPTGGEGMHTRELAHCVLCVFLYTSHYCMCNMINCNEVLKRPEWLGIDINHKTFVCNSQKSDSCYSDVSVACSCLHQGMMTKRSAHACKGVMVTVNDATGGEMLYE